MSSRIWNAWIRRVLGIGVIFFGLALGFFMVKKHLEPEYAALMATGNILFGIVLFVSGFFDFGVKPEARAHILEFPASNKEFFKREQNG